MSSRTPEHDKRGGNLGVERHPDVDAAYGYVGSVTDTKVDPNVVPGYCWSGWSLREAFLAGISHAQEDKLTVRDHFTLAAMHGMLATGFHSDVHALATDVLRVTDAVLQARGGKA